MDSSLGFHRYKLSFMLLILLVSADRYSALQETSVEINPRGKSQAHQEVSGHQKRHGNAALTAAERIEEVVKPQSSEYYRTKDNAIKRMDWVPGQMEDWTRSFQEDEEVNLWLSTSPTINNSFNGSLLELPDSLEMHDGHSGPAQLLGVIQGKEVSSGGMASWIPSTENVTSWIKVQQEWMMDSAKTMINSTSSAFTNSTVYNTTIAILNSTATVVRNSTLTFLKDLNTTNLRQPLQYVKETGLQEWAPSALQPSQMVAGFGKVLSGAAFDALNWSLGFIPVQWILENAPIGWTLQYLPLETALDYVPVEWVQNMVPEWWSLEYIQMEVLPEMGLEDTEQVMEKVADAVNYVTWLPGSKKEDTTVVFSQSTYVEDVGRSLLDPNSLQHASSGMIAYNVASLLNLFPGLGPLLSLGMAFIWSTLKDTPMLTQMLGEDAVEWLHYLAPYTTPADSKLNVVGDMMATLAGYAAAATADQVAGPLGKSAAFAALEAASIHNYGDSLSTTSWDFVISLLEKHVKGHQ